MSQLTNELIYHDYQKVSRVIASSKNEEHCDAAQIMIQLYEAKYPSEKGYINSLLESLRKQKIALECSATNVQ